MILFILQYGENFDKLQNKLLAFVPDYQFEEIEETGLFVVDATAKDEEELEEEGSLREIEESSSTSSEHRTFRIAINARANP